MSRKRKLYVSELLKRCTNKMIQVTITTKYQVLHYTSIKQTIEDLKNSWLWNYQVTGYTIVQNVLNIVAKDTK